MEFLLLVFALFAQTSLAQTTSGNSSNVGDFVAEGLQITTTSPSTTSTLPSTNNDSSPGVLQGPFDLPISPQTTLLTLLPGYTTLSPEDASSITADFSCAASHSAWLSSVHEPTNYATITVTTSTSFEAPVVLGTADVYTTSAGLAYAHGNFAPTSTSMWTFNGPTFTTTTSESPGPAYPSCS
ncbi:hypothetical protein LTR95_015798, partial [Oleoguttula sp. CCFEE 5521]